MNSQCLFCRIINNEIPAHKIYEDANTLAFLDINPLTKGHTLLIPKKHVTLIEELNTNESITLLKTITKIISKVNKGTNTQSSTIAINNGKESGQEIPHTHIHIIPRSAGDGNNPIQIPMTKRPNLNQNDFQTLATKIKS